MQSKPPNSAYSKRRGSGSSSNPSPDCHFALRFPGGFHCAGRGEVNIGDAKWCEGCPLAGGEGLWVGGPLGEAGGTVRVWWRVGVMFDYVAGKGGGDTVELLRLATLALAWHTDPPCLPSGDLWNPK